MKEEKNDVDMNVQCYLMHVGKDSWKEKVPTIVKQGALRFLVCPNSCRLLLRATKLQVCTICHWKMYGLGWPS